jgi:hypothetical protein
MSLVWSYNTHRTHRWHRLTGRHEWWNKQRKQWERVQVENSTAIKLAYRMGKEAGRAERRAAAKR